MEIRAKITAGNNIIAADKTIRAKKQKRFRKPNSKTNNVVEKTAPVVFTDAKEIRSVSPRQRPRRTGNIRL